MESAVAEFLRGLRRARGLTLEGAARAAGLSRSAVIRWETGVNQPRLPELEALLAALGAAPGQRLRAIALMAAPRARACVLETAARLGEDADIGARPAGGDLLRALRLRAGMSAAEAAARVAVTPRTLRRWERTEVWPTAEQLGRLCRALGAHEEEARALARARGWELAPSERVTLEALRARLEALALFRAWQSPLAELHLLTLAAQVWPLAARGVDGERLLAEVYATHAHFLSRHHQFAESAVYARRALALGPEKAPPEPFRVAAAQVLARAAVYRGPSPAPRRGWERLRPWLGAPLPPQEEAWLKADLAHYLATEGALDEALTVAAEAERAAVRSARPGPLRRRARDRARILVWAGRPGEALELLPAEDADDPADRVASALLWCEGLLCAGDRGGAHDALLRASAEIEQHPRLAYQRPRADALARRL